MIDLKLANANRMIEEKTLQIECAKERLKIYNALIEVLKRFEGKAVTKRIATALENSLPDYTVYYEKCKHMGSVRISVWKGKPEEILGYSNRFIGLIAYESECDSIDMNKVKNNLGNYASVDIAKMEASIRRTADHVAAYNRAINQLNAAIASARSEGVYLPN